MTRLLLLYSNENDPVVINARLLSEYKNEIIFLSLKSFINEVNINDELSNQALSIEWKYKKWIFTNNKSCYIINRLLSLNIDHFKSFEKDAEFVLNEYYSYFRFALASFGKNCIDMPNEYSLIGCHNSLILQWSLVSKHNLNLSVPPFFCGPNCSFSKKNMSPVDSSPYNLFFFKKNKHSTKKFLFRFFLPDGFFLIASLFENQCNLCSKNKEFDYLSSSLKNDIRNLALQVKQIFGYTFAEVLLLISSDYKIYFLSINKLMYATANSNFFKEHFDGLVTSILSKN